jgi:hypothetical protein
MGYINGGATAASSLNLGVQRRPFHLLALKAVDFSAQGYSHFSAPGCRLTGTSAFQVFLIQRKG